jgi:hypothetical protein
MNLFISRTMPTFTPMVRYMGGRVFKSSDKDAMIFPFGIGKKNNLVLTLKNQSFDTTRQVVLVMKEREFHSECKALNSYGIHSGEGLLTVVRKVPFSHLMRIIRNSTAIH